MTTAEIARHLRGRRYARGKYMAKCPAHGEKTGSLSICDMGAGRTRLHCFGGCNQTDVVRAAGLTWKDLRPGEVTHEIRGRIRDERQLERIERDWLYARLMCCHHAGRWPDGWDGMESILALSEIPSVIKRKPVSLRYWMAAYRRIGLERRELREKLNPEEKRAREFRERVRRGGWDEIWQSFLETEDGKRIEAMYGRNTADASAE